MSLISYKLLDWFKTNARLLPWRGLDHHPQKAYCVWIAETMLQQTRVDTVIPYYHHWLIKFPSLEVLAQADEQEVLKLWQGLGYYGRARRLLQTARIVVKENHGEFPKSKKDLMKLPGVGNYTAAAIASFVFDEDEYVIDGNVRRVLARLYYICDPIGSIQAEQAIEYYAKNLLVKGESSKFNQAIMELGQVICTTRQPKCSMCPINNNCKAKGKNKQEELPLRMKKKKTPHYNYVAAIIINKGNVLICRRKTNELLGGMWMFPNGRQKEGEEHLTTINREINKKLGINTMQHKKFGLYRHAFTHFKLTMQAYHCLINGESQLSLAQQDYAWCSMDELDNYPMAKIDRLITIDLQKREYVI